MIFTRPFFVVLQNPPIAHKIINSMKKIFVFLPAAVLLLFSACTSTGTQKVPKVHITNSKAVPVFPAAYDKTAVDKIFLFTGMFGEQEFTCNAYVQCDQNGMFMQAFSDFGTTLLTIECDSEGRVSAVSDMMPDAFAPFIVMDAQLSYYDFEPLRAALENASLTFTEETDGATLLRRVYNDDNLISEYSVDTQNLSLSVKNYLRDYEYNLAAYTDMF